MAIAIGSKVKAVLTVLEGGPDAPHNCLAPGVPCTMACPGFLHAHPGDIGTVVGLTDSPAIVTVMWGDTATDCWVGGEVIPYIPETRRSGTWALADMIAEAVTVARDCGLHGNELADFAREMALEWTRGGK